MLANRTGRNSNAFSLLSDDSPTKASGADSQLNVGKIGLGEFGPRPLQGFGNYEKHTTKEEISLESFCLLKTKTDRYK